MSQAAPARLPESKERMEKGWVSCQACDARDNRAARRMTRSWLGLALYGVEKARNLGVESGAAAGMAV